MSESTARLQMAVEAFRDVERVQLLLDKKEKVLQEIMSRGLGEHLPEYVRLTEEIRHEYEAKRISAKV